MLWSPSDQAAAGRQASVLPYVQLPSKSNRHVSDINRGEFDDRASLRLWKILNYQCGSAESQLAVLSRGNSQVCSSGVRGHLEICLPSLHCFSKAGSRPPSPCVSSLTLDVVDFHAIATVDTILSRSVGLKTRTVGLDIRQKSTLRTSGVRRVALSRLLALSSPFSASLRPMESHI